MGSYKSAATIFEYEEGLFRRATTIMLREALNPKNILSCRAEQTSVH